MSFFKKFLTACADGLTEEVNQLLKTEDFQNLPADDKNLALYLAAYNGHLSIVNRLLTIKTVQDTLASNENAALRGAAEGGNLAIVDQLLQNELVRKAVAVDNNTILYKAAKQGHLSVVNRLLEFKAVQELITSNNNFAFRAAAENGHLPVVKRLLEFETVQKEIAANDHEALRECVKYITGKPETERYAQSVFLVLYTYQIQNIPLPVDVKIQGKSLEEFNRNFIENHPATVQHLLAQRIDNLRNLLTVLEKPPLPLPHSLSCLTTLYMSEVPEIDEFLLREKKLTSETTSVSSRSI